jgi:integrase
MPLKQERQRRTITPPSIVFELLKEQLEIREAMRLKAGKLWNDSGLVFTNDIGGGLDADNVYQNFKKVLESAGLPNIRLHDLRHTAATMMLECGIDPVTVSVELGHYNAGFTLSQYGHSNTQMKRESAEKRDQFIKMIS